MQAEPLRRWPLALRLLHWGMAALLIGIAACGLVMVHGGLPVGVRFDLYQWHKSFGVLALALLMLRLGLRLVLPRPVAAGSPLMRRLAGMGQGLLYLVLALLPLSGWLMASASPFRIPTIVFGLFRLPALTGPDAATEALAKTAHLALAILLGILVIGHVAAALKHHWLDADATLRRMWRG